MHRNFLLNLLKHYQTDDSHERNMLFDLVSFVENNENCFDRNLQQGHITGSAWLINSTRNQIFFTHHKKLDRWLQPGGHSDNDANTLAVAMREASEESGIEDVFIQPVKDAIFDIDIHTIPARKSEPEHLHYDVRFLLEADASQPLKLSDESNEIRWFSLSEAEQICLEPSLKRMLDKTRHIFTK